jgi:hypothetical protein
MVRTLKGQSVRRLSGTGDIVQMACGRDIQHKISKLDPDNTAIIKGKGHLTHGADNMRPLCMIDSRPGMRVISAPLDSSLNISHITSVILSLSMIDKSQIKGLRYHRRLDILSISLI